MNLPECILTGCDFYDPMEVRWVHGDLHRLGDVYILNGCTTKGNCDWQYGTANPGAMVVSATQSAYFEKRGVIVFTAAVANFNDHAEQYMRRGADHLRRVL